MEVSSARPVHQLVRLYSFAIFHAKGRRHCAKVKRVSKGHKNQNRIHSKPLSGHIKSNLKTLKQVQRDKAKSID